MPKVLVIANSSAESLIVAKLMEKAKISYQAVHFDVGLTDDKPVMAGQRISKYGGMEHFIKNRVEIEKYDYARDFYAEILSKGGYESGPCLDHSVFLLRKAGQYIKKNGFDFIVTGDVLDSCSIVQTQEAFDRIDKEAGVEGLVLRPLSARIMPEVEIQRHFRIDPSILYSYQGSDTSYYERFSKEFDLFDLPSPESHDLKRDTGCHEEDMGRKAFEIFEKGIQVNPTHINRLGLHLTLENGAKVVMGRTPFESTYLNLFYQKTLFENAFAFSLQEPRYTFGFIYGPQVEEGQEYFAAKIMVSTAEPTDQPKEVSFFDSGYLYFGSKFMDPASFSEYGSLVNDHTNDLSCPIFTRFSFIGDPQDRDC